MSTTYDPMTGEPIETPDDIKDNVENKEASVENSTDEKVDSVTEATVNEANDTVNASEQSTTDNASTQSYEQADDFGGDEGASDKKAPKIVLGIIAAVALIAIICLIIFSGAFSKKKKVEKACAATLNIETQLIKDLKPVLKTMSSDQVTTNYSVSIDDMGDITGSVIVNGKDKQVTANIDVDELPKLTAKVGIDSKTVKAEIPEVIDKVFVYNYKEAKDGYITDMLDDEDIESIDKALQTIYDAQNSADPDDNKFAIETAKLIRKYSKELQFEKEDSKEFKIDGKKVNAKGISVEVDSDLIVDFWDDFTDLYLEEFGEEFEDIEDMTGESIKDTFKEVKSELKSFPDTEIIFYIYKGKLASIDIDAGKRNGEVEVLFKGGDFRAQNISIEADGEEVFELKGSKKNDKETYTFVVQDEEVCTLTYNTKKGSLTFEYSDGYDDYEYEAKIESKGDSFKIIVEDIEVSYDTYADIEIEIVKGAKIQKYSGSEEFDIGNADEDEFTELLDDVDEDIIDELSYLF
ncbi:MAG: hypothetical protein K6G69_08480 [Lachnospiraceae bacterium]|nr:hypothetical protein [Lachnospiraceae bacterium]